MERYDAHRYYGHIVKGELRAAVEYLEQFPGQKRFARRCREIFEEGKQAVHTGRPQTDRIMAAFYEYYARVFWQGQDRLAGAAYLCNTFGEQYGLACPEHPTEAEMEALWENEIEPCLERAVTAEGYRYLGGDTQGYLGPYIWKRTRRCVFRVKLPDGTAQFPVNMMTGFVSCSWMSAISLGRIGAGGWAGADGVLCCVLKRYLRRMLTPVFHVDFLKHEAQHTVDNKAFPGMTPLELEYRAKLVQLCYARSMQAFWGFLSEADAHDTWNSHAYASYLLVRNLSRAVFGSTFVSDRAAWRGRRRQLAKLAGKLFDAFPDGMEPDDPAAQNET